ncbi:hypothetical protein [Vibrio sp. THAF190c]|uniref:hypothetical protein n=1 Tax=Vibrio sp. THAF190c TaxID=2587865 RepID=UPI0012683605|nr:hypothetical protein [Vibrio sp. THAF190c]QFT09707.1 hypothetical protein FIV04_06975 [Vibrio sp. THAF190c]QFT09713.1 hypothetical protein FIV04_07005 [Vibrio sp. THAF190c]
MMIDQKATIQVLNEIKNKRPELIDESLIEKITQELDTFYHEVNTATLWLDMVFEQHGANKKISRNISIRRAKLQAQEWARKLDIYPHILDQAMIVALWLHTEYECSNEYTNLPKSIVTQQ